ncbi:MAG: aspartate aminotransferase family protein [Aigarchaeota archaeon]|nr:aspartate aminotransferase family protein [Aigarchaeota archaeon]MDW8093313.1 aspartate aminotransferase family protein [Nitrososphaerota archaeon]
MNGSLGVLGFSAGRGIRIVRGSGQYVWDSQDRRYLDFHCGNGAAFLGHSNPLIINRIKEQMEELMVCMPIFDTPVLERCLRALSRVLPNHLREVYFLNSGSESVELAMKLARKQKDRKRFVYFTGAFHGRTMGALSVTYNQRYKQGFEPFPWEQVSLPFNDFDQLRKIDDGVAGVIVEPVQGEGGLNVADSGFLRELENRCREVGAYLIVDEVQSGFGRTGRVWAHLVAGIEPDIMVAGKSIGGGFPVSLVAVSEEVAGRVEEGEHGSTYGGNPLALAAVEAAVDVLIKESVPEKSDVMGKRLWKRLLEVSSELQSVVRGVKGRGLMVGLDLRFSPTDVLKLTQLNGLLTLKAGGTVLRLLPPYLINEEDVEFSGDVITRSVSAARRSS